MWQLPLAAGIFSISITLILQRVLLSEDNDPIAYAIVAQLIAGVLLFILFFASGNAPVKANFISSVPNLILMTLLYVGLNIFSFKAIKRIEISEFTILFSTRSFWAILMAILFLKETFNAEQIIGTVLLFASVILVSFKSTRFSLNKGELLALLSAVFVGAAFINDAYTSKFFDLNFYNAVAFLLPGFALWAIYPKKTNQILELFKKRKTAIPVILTGVLYTFSQTLILTAYQYGSNAAVIGSLLQFVSILTVWLAFVFLKERKDVKKRIIAAVISIIGAIMIR